jgi:hypothetical protein
MRQEHMEIAQALYHRDPDLAEKLMVEHINHAQAKAIEGVSRRLGIHISAYNQQVTLEPQVSEQP